MSTTNHTTAGRQSRLAVSAALAFAHQDAGIESALNSGCLDATDHMPAGACYGAEASARAAKLYHEGDFKSMCAAICRHISAVQIKHSI